jgi:hypothetical protein
MAIFNSYVSLPEGKASGSQSIQRFLKVRHTNITNTPDQTPTCQPGTATESW